MLEDVSEAPLGITAPGAGVTPPGLIVDWTTIQPREHFVQFYEADAYLVRAVTGYLAVALAARQPAVMIGTAAHCQAVRAALKEQGLDPEKAQEEGSFILLDAAETLELFMAGDMPDPVKFRRTVGAMIERCAARGARVYAFGEMVALLWADGRQAGAARLEQLWNELGREFTFSLFCAYPMEKFGGEHDGAAFTAICGCHARVIPAESFESLPTPAKRAVAVSHLQQQVLVLGREVARRGETEAELARRERDLADFLENVPESLHQVDEDGTILWANRTELGLLGYSAAEYVGRRIQEFHIDQASIEEIFSQLKRGKEVRDMPARLRCKNGAVKEVLVSSSARFENGRLAHTRCFTRDVTEARRLAQARQASEVQYRTLFDAMNEGYCVIEVKFDDQDRPVDFRYLDVNPVFEKHTGLKDARGRWARELIPALEQHWIDAYGHVAKTGETLRFENPVAALGRHFEVCACRVEDPGLRRVAVVFNDVTARKQMEAQRDAELAASGMLHDVSTELIRDGQIEVVFEKIMSAAVGIMRSDFGSMQMLYPERGAKGELKLLAAHGFPAEAVQFWQWVRADSNCTCGAVLRSGRRVIAADVQTCDFMAGTADQVALLQAGMLAAQSTPLISRSGKLLGMISTHWKRPHTPAERDLRLLDVLARQTADLIERTEVAAQLRRAKQEADDASRAKDKFLAVLSHELRTPLTPVLLTAAQLEQRTDLPATVAEDVTMIRRNVELQSRLIDDLLDISRIMSGKLSFATDRVSLNEAIRRAAEICQPTLQESGVHLSLDLAEDLPAVSGDGARLQQVIWNLLSNAAKFTQAGGHVYVRTEGEGKVVRAIVGDTGRGIEPEKLERVFDAFEQGEAGITRQFGGLGLGLAICRAIVEQHRGRIQVASGGAGQGATFTVELPALPLARPGPDSPVVHGVVAAGVRSLQVLLVEDHADTARILARMLTARGHVVKTAGSGASALTLADAHPFEVVVSDLGLPDMLGSDLIRQIKARHKLKGIAMSGYGMEEDLRRSRESGFEEHLVKPVKIEQLEDALRRITGQHGGTRGVPGGEI